jgi:hypothetical protein
MIRSDVLRDHPEKSSHTMMQSAVLVLSGKENLRLKCISQMQETKVLSIACLVGCRVDD